MKYTELEVWKEARILVNEVYLISKDFPSEELYGLTNQMRRCAISIPSNIAEGCGRQHYKDSLRFFFIARGSLYELETQIYLAKDQSYINKEISKKLMFQIEKCRKLLSGFINYYKDQSTKKLNEPISDYSKTTDN
ncbi:MAG: four helix bundle protein [Bacteroidetes bacterium]|nr:MAG: four helix bundle protein [Bacteroidota bacterium]